MDWIERIRNARSDAEKVLLLGAWLSNEAEKRGIKPPVVVGGSAVEVYSFGFYRSADVDLVGSREFIKSVLLSSGYFREEGRFFVSEELGLFVEVPDSSLAGSYQKVREVPLPNHEGKAHLIGIEDLIVDRLCACEFWRSENDCLIAEYLVKKFMKELDIPYLRERAKKERVDRRLESILDSAEECRNER